jgi:prepilin-type N-terminal cleavage/methylation domain-containing protein
MKYSIQQGFTLIEITMVLFILGLLMASFLDPLATRVEQEERNKTQIQLDIIEEILYGYVLQNLALPCPDCSDNTGGCAAATADDGIADLTVPGICDTEVGNLPWTDMGVKGTDEWNNEFTYRVDDVFADSTDGTACAASATLGVSFSLCSDGDIIVNDLAVAGSNVASLIPAIVVSHGKNWATSASADEAENTDGDATFVDKDYSQTAGAEFDDLMIWISPHILRTMTVKAGILP